MPGARSSSFVSISASPLSIPAVLPMLRDPASGGLAIFIGRVRDESHGGSEAPTVLRYEAYEPLAKREFERLSATAIRRFGVRRVVIQHRTGKLKAGEPSVLVAVAAPHRKEAFAACRFLIDTLKREAPIWKTPVPSSRRGR